MLLSLIIKQAPNIYKETIAYLASSMVKRKELNGCYCLHSLDVCSDVGLSAGLSGVGLALLVYCLIFANSNLR